jgi:SAM-dependent methyltransferase
VSRWSPKNLLAHPGCYHYLRQALTGGMPFAAWVRLYGLSDPKERVADLGCGPADVLRYLRRGAPAFYLGVDVSDRYLGAARRRAARAAVPSRFVAMDLSRTSHDPAAREALLGLLDEHRITRALLLGVLHHVDDAAAAGVLGLVARAPTVRRLVTTDVVYLRDNPGLAARVNNWLCDRDRGRHVRDEAGYDALARRSSWPHFRKVWTSPNLGCIRYIHYEFAKDAVAEAGDAPRFDPIPSPAHTEPQELQPIPADGR